MKIIEVIESRCWLNIETGQTVSVYGSVPWSSDVDKSQWSMHVRGYTWRLDNGTIGLGRQPVKTFQEAQTIMDQFNRGA